MTFDVFFVTKNVKKTRSDVICIFFCFLKVMERNKSGNDEKGKAKPIN